MKKLIIYLFSIMLIAPAAGTRAAGISSLSADRTTASDMPAVIAALKKGDADAVAGYFGQSVDVQLPGSAEQKGLSKQDAQAALKTFFSKNGINGFELASEREMGSTSYIAGKLTGTASSNLTIMMKEHDGRAEIITVRIN